MRDNGPGDLAPAALAPLRPVRRWPLRTAAVAFLAMMIVGGSAVAWALGGVSLPDPATVTARRVVLLQSADGQYLPAGGMVQLAPVAADDMGKTIVNAVLSIEDRGFYREGALDPWSTLRAARQNLDAGEIVSGGSTITQQLVKMLFVGPQRTYLRKIHEAAIAIWLQHKLTKSQILTSYLNDVYLGSAAIGLPAAAKVYFDKDVRDLSVAQAAMLAGMINAPSKDDPFHNLETARRRAAVVLDAMVANGKLSAQDAFLARLNPAAPIRSEIAPRSAGWFADWVYGKAAAATPALAGPVAIRTTLDLRLQRIAAAAINSALAQYGGAKHVTEAALVAMRPDGAVVAMVGGRSYTDSQYNRAVQAQRQPGSAFKLFDYYAALRQGYSPESEVLDGPVDVKGWQPENYGRHYHGEVTLAEAFANSLNAATVRLTQQVGIGDVIAAARDLGLRAPLKPLPSIVLGTADVSLLDLTSAYDAVRAGAAPVVPRGIAGIRMGDAKAFLKVGPPTTAQHSLGAYQDKLISLLQGVVEHGTGRAAALPGFAAGKTGTTQDYRDAWFVGFDNSFTVGVWVGNDDHSPMRGVVGGSIPAMIWKSFMTQAAATASTATGAPNATEQTASAAAPPDGAAAPPDQKEQTASKAALQAKAELQEERSRGALFDQAAVGAVPSSSSVAACNIPVCSQSYHSFRASDCSYQPFAGGPRRLCDR